MGYWTSSFPLIWTDAGLAIFDTEEFHIVDGGAAGDLFEPFDAVSDHCRVYTFEPRGTEAIEYQARVNIDAGLWKEPDRRILHVAEGPKASSIYPPNLSYLQRFPRKLGTGVRRTATMVEVPLTSIDNEVRNGVMPKPNFIKLDIHSAEYEALLGSLESLGECLGLLVETWYAPVHAGQHLNGEVEVLLQNQGFQLYDSRQASVWPHALEDESLLRTERRQLVGAESLFLREIPPPHLCLQYLALLELFGYTTLAIRMCDQMLSGSLKHETTIGKIENVRATLLQHRKARVKQAHEEQQKAKHERLEKVYQERRKAKKSREMAKRKEAPLAGYDQRKPE